MGPRGCTLKEAFCTSVLYATRLLYSSQGKASRTSRMRSRESTSPPRRASPEGVARVGEGNCRGGSSAVSIDRRVLFVLFIDHAPNLSYEMNARPWSCVQETEEETPMLSLTMRTKPEARLLQAGWSTCAPSLPCPEQGSYLRPLHLKGVDRRFENAEGLS